MNPQQLIDFNALSTNDKHTFVNILKYNFLAAGNNRNYATQAYIQEYLNTIPKF